MLENNIVWSLFVATDESSFPNFYPIGVYSSEAKALAEISKLPRNYHYQLFQIPLDQCLSKINKRGKLVSGLGHLQHEHYVPTEE